MLSEKPFFVFGLFHSSICFFLWHIGSLMSTKKSLIMHPVFAMSLTVFKLTI
uniref:Uncharacterized protein n=1 Tax=Rhizophora mucronata TaxID=61149 RepID=A0A2P2QS35_RHIMU